MKKRTKQAPEPTVTATPPPTESTWTKVDAPMPPAIAFTGDELRTVELAMTAYCARVNLLELQVKKESTMSDALGRAVRKTYDAMTEWHARLNGSYTYNVSITSSTTVGKSEGQK